MGCFVSHPVVDRRSPQNTLPYPPSECEFKEVPARVEFDGYKEQHIGSKAGDTMSKLYVMERDGSIKLMQIVTSLCDHMPEKRDQLKSLRDLAKSIDETDFKSDESLLQAIFRLRELQSLQETLIREELQRTRNEAMKVVQHTTDAIHVSVHNLEKLGCAKDESVVKEGKRQMTEWETGPSADLISRIQSGMQLLSTIETYKDQLLPDTDARF